MPLQTYEWGHTGQGAAGVIPVAVALLGNDHKPSWLSFMLMRGWEWLLEGDPSSLIRDPKASGVP